MKSILCNTPYTMLEVLLTSFIYNFHFGTLDTLQFFSVIKISLNVQPQSTIRDVSLDSHSDFT